jgi:hypothetical protein
MINGSEKLIGLNEYWARWVTYALGEADRAGLSPTVTSGLRSRSEQARLYADYVAGRRRLPAAPPGRSAHEYGLAVDVVSSNGKQSALIALFKRLGAETVSGDPPHFQYPGYSAWLRS